MILDEIVQKKKLRLIDRKNKIPTEIIKAKAEEIVKKENDTGYINKFKNALSRKGLSVIGEYKKASPSKGIIKENFNIEEIYDFYKYMDVDTFSVLTEEDYFKGSDENILKLKNISKTPILRKDFIIDYYQIYEAKVLGADGILLIAAVLKESLGDYYNEAKNMNLQPLVEVHNKEELDLALKFNCDVIGINNRDLKTFNVTFDTFKNLKQYVPQDKILISESGIMSLEDLKKIASYGADGVLIGEFFMRNIFNEEFKKEYKDLKQLL
ncbi:MAG TPA: indole-3-glycerol phosphate synthase TrpC [Clostridium sp.]|nr:indole-3-glycerol phosphate synthase TrpC [Clostridium sp.]